jgi:hypothetical protein
MGKKGKKYNIKLRFEGVELPPFQDILVVGKNTLQGKIGISKALELLIPNGFDFVEINNKRVEAIFISKRISKKISSKKIIKVLEKKVFPYVADGELLKVDLKLGITYSTFETANF